MKTFYLLFLALIFLSCNQVGDDGLIVMQAEMKGNVEYLIVDKDTSWLSDGTFKDSLELDNARYEYLQLNTWKWPKLIYLDPGKDLKIDFNSDEIVVENDPINTYLLNKDSILISYTATWDMTEDEFQKRWESEMSANLSRIDSLFKDTKVPTQQLSELKQIELMVRAHMTANFISYQERNGNKIDRSIYDFVSQIDLHNERLAKQVNNRNFQYFYTLDKVDHELADSIYPFRAIDTINHYVKIKSIRDMIIRAVIKSSFYSDEVDHKQLFASYEQNIGALGANDPIMTLYQRIQALRPQNPAPAFGELKSIDGKTYSIDHFKGQNILITVWGSWCPYCKEELLHLKELMQKYGDVFTSLSISFDQEEPNWKDYIETNNWSGIHLIDSDRKSTFKKNYLINGTNRYFLIDKTGMLLSSSKYKPSSPEMEDLIKGLN